MHAVKSKIHPLLVSPLAVNVIATILILGIILAAWFVDKNSIEFEKLTLDSYQHYSCTTAVSDTPKPRLKVLTFLIGEDARTLTQSLCKQSSIKQSLGGVETTWQVPAQLDLRTLDNQEFDVLFYRASILEKLPGYAIQGYSMIAKLPSYTSILISRDSKPELTNDFFRDKVLGLIDDPLSSAGYGIPKTALAQAGIDTGSYTIRSFGSKKELERALAQKEVDLISSYSESPLANDPRFSTLILSNPLPGPAWYIRTSLIGTPIHCGFINALNSLSFTTISGTLPKAQIIQGCHEEVL